MHGVIVRHRSFSANPKDRELVGSEGGRLPSAMDFSKWRKMDGHLLVGLVNTELRNHCESLDDLVKTHDIPERELVTKLREAGYEYQPGQKQFR